MPRIRGVAGIVEKSRESSPVFDTSFRLSVFACSLYLVYGLQKNFKTCDFVYATCLAVQGSMP